MARMDAILYGKAIRRQRSLKGWSQKSLADRAGLQQNTLSALETKGQGMKLDLFVHLCLTLQADPIEVADQAYYWFRNRLRREVEKAPDRGGASRDASDAAVPSLEELDKLYDSATSAGRRLLMGVLKRLQPEAAMIASVIERLNGLDEEPPSPKPRKPKPKKKRKISDRS
jgi:transcriptional regulator with XRE-family HTH domain